MKVWSHWMQDESICLPSWRTYYIDGHNEVHVFTSILNSITMSLFKRVFFQDAFWSKGNRELRNGDLMDCKMPLFWALNEKLALVLYWRSKRGTCIWLHFECEARCIFGSDLPLFFPFSTVLLFRVARSVYGDFRYDGSQRRRGCRCASFQFQS